MGLPANGGSVVLPKLSILNDRVDPVANATPTITTTTATASADRIKTGTPAAGTEKGTASIVITAAGTSAAGTTAAGTTFNQQLGTHR